jgi:hypothetical protein
MIRIPAALVVLMAAVAPPQKTAAAVPLTARVALPDGYASEQDTESDGAFNFAQVPWIRGHILRRFVQAGDDKSTPLTIVGHFASEIHGRGGVVLNDRFNNLTGRIDGRIPGPKPVWLHAEVSDEGGVIDVVLLEERVPVPREIPLEEQNVPGTWTAESPDGARVAPLLQPYRGWAWHSTLDGGRVRLFGFARTQACASCAVVTDTAPVTMLTFDPTAKTPPNVPSRRGGGELSLYQNQLIETILATIR